MTGFDSIIESLAKRRRVDHEEEQQEKVRIVKEPTTDTHLKHKIWTYINPYYTTLYSGKLCPSRITKDTAQKCWSNVEDWLAVLLEMSKTVIPKFAADKIITSIQNHMIIINIEIIHLDFYQTFYYFPKFNQWFYAPGFIALNMYNIHNNEYVFKNPNTLTNKKHSKLFVLTNEVVQDTCTRIRQFKTSASTATNNIQLSYSILSRVSIQENLILETRTVKEIRESKIHSARLREWFKVENVMLSPTSKQTLLAFNEKSEPTNWKVYRKDIHKVTSTNDNNNAFDLKIEAVFTF